LGVGAPENGTRKDFAQSGKRNQHQNSSSRREIYHLHPSEMVGKQKKKKGKGVWTREKGETSSVGKRKVVKDRGLFG